MHANRRWLCHEARWRVGSLVLTALMVVACGSKSDQAPAPAGQESAPQTPAAVPVAATDAAPAPVPAAAVTQASWAPDALEELLAPIALYPDQLLGQILAASVNSQEVLDGGNWLLENESLKGDQLDQAAQKAGFGPAMRALVQFPSVVDMMCQQIDWTRQVGSAFSSDQTAVLDAVQRLRLQAKNTGNLQPTPQQTVETKTENNKVVVEVKPADPQVIYVPQYDPQVVYTTSPPAPATTTVVEEKSGVSTGALVATGLIAFGIGVMVGDHHDDYYYPHWGYGSVYYGPRPFYPPAYVYRPVYGPAFRPAYHYTSPPGYRYNYNNVNIHNDVNINVNNNNYFNRFEQNQNLRAGNTNSPIGSNRGATQNRAGQAGVQQHAGQADNWKGRSSYAGAKNTAAEQRLSQAAGTRPSTAHAAGQARAGDRQLGGSSGTRNPAIADKAKPALASRPQQHVDRGYGNSSRTAAREPAARPMPTRNTTSTPSPAKRDNAFSGAHQQGGGSFDRAASARGHASVGAKQTGSRGRRR